MFKQYDRLFLQKDPSFKNRGKMYNIISNEKVIGKIEEQPDTINHFWNQLLKFTHFSNTVSLHLNVLDEQATIQGIMKKKKGYYNDFHLYSKDGEPLATIKPTIKVKSSTLSVIDMNGKVLIEAVSGYGATDFSVIDCESQKQISSIKRRSLVYETVKDNFLNDDGYYIDHNDLDDLTTLSLMTMGIIIDMYYFDS